jgi:AbrB family looped-hinge helix DNA binding protein
MAGKIEGKMQTKRLTGATTTVLSEKGQVVIPKRFREDRGWLPGLRLVVESTRDGLSLRPLDARRSEAAAALLGCTGYRGPRRSLSDMEAAIRIGARKTR